MALVVKNSTASAGDLRDMGSVPGREDPQRRAQQPTPLFLPGECHGQRTAAWWATVYSIAKS